MKRKFKYLKNEQVKEPYQTKSSRMKLAQNQRAYEHEQYEKAGGEHDQYDQASQPGKHVLENQYDQALRLGYHELEDQHFQVDNHEQNDQAQRISDRELECQLSPDKKICKLQVFKIIKHFMRCVFLILSTFELLRVFSKFCPKFIYLTINNNC